MCNVFLKISYRDKINTNLIYNEYCYIFRRTLPSEEPILPIFSEDSSDVS